MTNITYFDEDNEVSIEVKGHAGYAPIGSDIVCSAVSVLIQTALAYFDATCDVFEYSMKSGYVWMHAKGKDVRTAFNVIMTGYWLLEQNYPDNISIDRGCSMQTDASLV